MTAAVAAALALPAVYGSRTEEHVRIRMSDGAILQADVTVPTDTQTGEPARGPFPVILVQTPYGRSGSGKPYVAPDGAADVVTYGQQVASMRALDPGRSWHRGGTLIAPYHHFTRRPPRPS